MVMKYLQYHSEIFLVLDCVTAVDENVIEETKTNFISSWNVAGALLRPNGITLYS
jgi:hypothetical protein